MSHALAKTVRNYPAPEGNFVEDGFTIIRGGIRASLSLKFLECFDRSLNKHTDREFRKPAAESSIESFFDGMTASGRAGSAYEVLKPVWKDLIHANLLNDLFLEPVIYNLIADILGKDLCYKDDPQLTVNLPGISSSKENYLFKNYHQEVWSGASIHTLQFWTPLFQRDRCGQLCLIKGSHLWGHIPHRNREPISLPDKYEEVETDLDIGDVILFHSLLLHRSTPIPANGRPRIGLPCLLKNFRFPNDSFECYSNWRIFSFSDLSLIDRRLGNHYLSPFRLIDLPGQKFTDNMY
jgi:hypothetical protein